MKPSPLQGKAPASIAVRGNVLYMYIEGDLEMLAVRLDPELEKRLTDLAKKTGRTKTFYARAAIEEYIDDLEDYFLAEERMRNFEPGDGIPLDQVKAELGLDD